MKVRLNQLWKVPVFCIAAGFVSFYLFVYAIATFGIVNLPDGGITTNDALSTALMIFNFGASMILGWLLLRQMTKREIFWSATILVSAQLILQTLQLATAGTNLAFSNHIGILLTYATEWYRLISEAAHALIDNPWVGAFLICLVPYIFVPFGRKEISQ